jgi:hypothetical protein
VPSQAKNKLPSRLGKLPGRKVSSHRGSVSSLAEK